MTKKAFLILLITVYFVAAAGSWAAFQTVFSQNQSSGGSSNSFASLISPLVPKAGKGAVDVEETAPKTEACPLNGKLFTEAERNAWEQRTPLAVMIENHVEARPQSGLSSADVVYEAIAEGGITRFMAMVYCDAQAKDVLLAPVRSARTYFIDWASSYQKPLYTHVGGANLPGPADALGQLSDYGWVGDNDLNQFSIGFPTFARNYNRVELDSGKSLATEHTMETSSQRLWKYAKENRDITTWEGAEDFEPWTSAEEPISGGDVTNITYNFWDGYQDFLVEWQYDSQDNSYARTMGGEPHVDLNNNEQIKAKNVVVLLTTEKGPIDEAKHMLYGTTGTGDALIFRGGEVVEATWSKPRRTSPLQFQVRGDDVELNRGLTWISTVGLGTDVEYESADAN